MSAWISQKVAGAPRIGLRGGVLLAGAMLAGGLAAGAASAATMPQPAAGLVPGAATTASEMVRVFYQQARHSLTLVPGSATVWGAPQNLGGALTSGTSAITVTSGIEFADTWVFARGQDNAVWFRQFSDGRGTWGPWTSMQGRALGTPAATCVGAERMPTVAVRGGDGALWMRALSGGGWQRLGGRLASDPGTLPAVATICPSGLEFFALGTDHAVWDFSGGWQRVGGRSAAAPAAVRLANGETDLFVRGSDNALWMNVRASGASSWSGWRRIGGVLTSAPVATVFPSSPQTRRVFALGADGGLWTGRNVVGASTWSWTQVP